MPQIPLPRPRPDDFSDRFGIQPYPQFRTGTDEAAKETLTNMLRARPDELTQFIADLQNNLSRVNRQYALNMPWRSDEVAKMEEPEPAEARGITPTPLLEIPDPSGHQFPDMAYMFPIPEYQRVGWPEALNPRTFAARLAEAHGVDTTGEDSTKTMNKPIDKAEKMVEEEIDNPKGD